MNEITPKRIVNHMYEEIGKIRECRDAYRVVLEKRGKNFEEIEHETIRNILYGIGRTIKETGVLL